MRMMILYLWNRFIQCITENKHRLYYTRKLQRSDEVCVTFGDVLSVADFIDYYRYFDEAGVNSKDLMGQTVVIRRLKGFRPNKCHRMTSGSVLMASEISVIYKRSSGLMDYPRERTQHTWTWKLQLFVYLLLVIVILFYKLSSLKCSLCLVKIVEFC